MIFVDTKKPVENTKEECDLGYSRSSDKSERGGIREKRRGRKSGSCKNSGFRSCWGRCPSSVCGMVTDRPGWVLDMVHKRLTRINQDGRKRDATNHAKK